MIPDDFCRGLVDWPNRSIWPSKVGEKVNASNEDPGEESWDHQSLDAISAKLRRWRFPPADAKACPSLDPLI